MRATNIVKLWAETFNLTHISEDAELVSNFKDLIALLARSNSTIADHITLVLDRGRPTQVPILFSVLPHPNPLNLCSIPPIEVAKQLCLINCRLNSTVKLSEFYNSGWTKGISPGLHKITTFTNKLTYWLATQVVEEENSKKRTKILRRIIKLSKALLELKNFNSLMAVYLTLNLSPIVRLKQTWKLLPRSLKAVLKTVEGTMSPLNNFNGYRVWTKGLVPPMIPCTEILLKDLLYQNESSPNFLDEEQMSINLQKLNSMGKIIRDFFFCVSETDYGFTMEPEIFDALVNCPTYTFEEVRQKSLTVEPPEDGPR
eukprot:TRINITY_DN5027_c0_g1_i23.p1 TRINITY_DN5027_c0_g1~~TRINITY_DN5027_c0_g1_i23.p1  ORF type:complete len:314 (+),score=54.76 TRINITY_DN5027_c0_g1_i23:2587-3528(+)